VNNVCVTGRLGRDPELKYTQSGKALANVRLAISDGKDATTWVDVVVWQETAEALVQYCHSGDEIGVVGRLQSREWEAKDGGTRKVLEIIAQRVDFLRKKGESGGASGGNGGQQQARPEPSPWPDDATDDPFGDQ
jgi:single-strand DNA-binding protein